MTDAVKRGTASGAMHHACCWSEAVSETHRHGGGSRPWRSAARKMAPDRRNRARAARGSPGTPGTRGNPDLHPVYIRAPNYPFLKYSPGMGPNRGPRGPRFGPPGTPRGPPSGGPRDPEKPRNSRKTGKSRKMAKLLHDFFLRDPRKPPKIGFPGPGPRNREKPRNSDPGPRFGPRGPRKSVRAPKFDRRGANLAAAATSRAKNRRARQLRDANVRDRDAIA